MCSFKFKLCFPLQIFFLGTWWLGDVNESAPIISWCVLGSWETWSRMKFFIDVYVFKRFMYMYVCMYVYILEIGEGMGKEGERNIY